MSADLNLESITDNLFKSGKQFAIYKATCKIYDKIFSRYERPDYNLKAGVYCYERANINMNPAKIHFLSDNVKLAATVYNAKNPKGLVVISHGLHSGGDDYLPIAKFFFQNNYSVFTFNYKGTYESEGNSTVGMCESLVDLNHALDFIESQPEYNSLPCILVGHSWGGFAVSSVLSLHKNVKACAVIAGFNDAYTLIVDKGIEYTENTPVQLLKAALSKNKTLASFSELAFNSTEFTKPFLDKYQKELFGRYTEYTALQGINSVSIPILIAHGDNDIVISKKHQSLFAYKDLVTNDNVIWYDGKGFMSGHDSIWHSEQSAIYREQVKKTLKKLEQQKGEKLSYNEKKEYYKTVDHELYSEINPELFNKILTMIK